MKMIQSILLIIWLIVSTYYIPYALIYRNLKSLKFLTVAMIVQNLVSLFASNTFPGILSQYVVIYKEVILWGTIAFVFVQTLRFKKNTFPIFVVVIYIIICFVKSDVNLYTKLVCFRQLMTPVVLILYGRTLKLTDSDKIDYLKFVVDWGIFQSVFGLIELFILGDKFWLSINISHLFETKGFDRWTLSGLPGNYYSADFYHLIGKSIRRLVGITTDPLLTSHYLAFCIIILLFTNLELNKMKRYFELSVMTIAVLLTISKGALLIVGIAYTYKLWIYNRKLSYISIGTLIILISIIVRTNIFRTVSIHLTGFLTGLSEISLFGHGIGTAGNLASLNGSTLTSGESFFGMVIGQMGVLGLVLFIWMIHRMNKLLLKRTTNIYGYAVVAYMIGLMVEAIVSESAINFVGSGCAFIILGYFTTINVRFIKEINYENRNINISSSL